MDTPRPEAVPGRLADNIVYFARILRDAGLPVGPASVIDAIRAVEIGGIAQREDLYWTLHAVLVTKREHHLIFDEAFKIYWRNRQLVEKMLAMMSPVARPAAAPEKPKAGASRVANAMSAGQKDAKTVERPEVEVDARMTVSEKEILQGKDFAQMSAAEIAKAKEALKSLHLPADEVSIRRLVPMPRGRLIDPRGSMRATLRSGGDLIRLVHRDRKTIHPPIVALLDISDR